MARETDSSTTSLCHKNGYQQQIRNSDLVPPPQEETCGRLVLIPETGGEASTTRRRGPKSVCFRETVGVRTFNPDSDVLSELQVAFNGISILLLPPVAPPPPSSSSYADINSIHPPFSAESHSRTDRYKHHKTLVISLNRDESLILSFEIYGEPMIVKIHVVIDSMSVVRKTSVAFLPFPPSSSC